MEGCQVKKLTTSSQNSKFGGVEREEGLREDDVPCSTTSKVYTARSQQQQGVAMITLAIIVFLLPAVASGAKASGMSLFDQCLLSFNIRRALSM